MSLYATLLRFPPGHEEDSLTEVFAHLLDADARARGPESSLAVRWFRSLRVAAAPSRDAPEPVSAVRVATQRRYPASAGGGAAVDHSSDSVVDLVVELDRTDGSREVVFVESKVGSVAGPDQLQRYADHLGAIGGRPGVSRTALVYLTRNPDPVARATVVPPGHVEVVSARWHGVYRVVSDARDEAHPDVRALYSETLAFLAHLRMDTPTRLDEADALALGRLPKLVQFMDETFDGVPDDRGASVSDRFHGLTGSSTRLSSRLGQLADRRYMLHREHWGGSRPFAVRLGYWLVDRPTLGLSLESGPHDPVAEVLLGLPGTDPEGGWTARRDPNGWAVAYFEVPFGDLPAETDHVTAAQGVFHGFLDRLTETLELRPPLDAAVSGGPQ